MAPEQLAEIPEARLAPAPEKAARLAPAPGKAEATARELKPRPSKARLAPDSAPQAAASAEHHEEPEPPKKKTKNRGKDEDDEDVGGIGVSAVAPTVKRFRSYVQELHAHVSTAEAVIRDVNGTESFFQHKIKKRLYASGDPMLSI